MKKEIDSWNFPNRLYTAISHSPCLIKAKYKPMLQGRLKTFGCTQQ